MKLPEIKAPKVRTREMPKVLRFERRLRIVTYLGAIFVLGGLVLRWCCVFKDHLRIARYLAEQHKQVLESHWKVVCPERPQYFTEYIMPLIESYADFGECPTGDCGTSSSM